MAKKKKDEKPKLIDSGTVAGSLAASVVLALWLFVEFSGSAEAGSNSSQGKASIQETISEKNAGKIQDSAPVAPPQNSPTWKDDPKWNANLSLGKEGIQQAKDAVKWNEEKGGDPFYFANQIHEAGEKVDKAIRGMESLKKEKADNPEAIVLIDKWLSYFKKNQPRRSK